MQTKAYQLYRKMKETYFKARENARMQAKYMKTQYDKRVNSHVFKPGDQCFVFINGDRPKFARRWNGPFLVAKRISDHTYVILVDPDEGVYETVNIQKIKPYVPNKSSPVMGRAGRDGDDRSYTRAQEDDDQELEWTRIEIREPLPNGGSVLEEWVKRDLTFHPEKRRKWGLKKGQGQGMLCRRDLAVRPEKRRL